MTCPKCHSEFETTGAVCPECGVRFLRNVSGVMKTSAVLIAARGGSSFYHSVRDVPEPLRTQLLETTGSRNSGTIVIADRAGKEQLTQALSRRESAREPRRDETPQTAIPSDLPEAQPADQVPRSQWIAWWGLILVLAIAAVIAALFYLHW
jgi:hypothetical protein